MKKNTNTYYEPYVETIIDDTITDDRNYFYLNKANSLYLYVSFEVRMITDFQPYLAHVP